jgi:hypothetical protein
MSVISRKATAVIKDGAKAAKVAVMRPFKKHKHSFSTRTQSSVSDDNADPAPTDHRNDPIQVDSDNDVQTNRTTASSDMEEPEEDPVDLQKELGRCFINPYPP